MWLQMKRTHWILIALIVVFLSFYFGLLSWSRVEDALETLAANPGSGAKVFAAKVDRADAIFMIFMILFLTPLAIVAVGGLIVFVTAALAGFFHAFVRARDAPFWVYSGFAYLVLVVVGYFTRAYWMPEVQGVASLVARALLAASR